MIVMATGVVAAVAAGVTTGGATGVSAGIKAEHANINMSKTAVFFIFSQNSL